MQTYNGVAIPSEIHPKYIISGFSNPVNEGKIERYREGMMETMDIEYTFPPIMGYPIIMDIDIMEDEVTFINGEDIEESDIGKLVWVVTDGHHRSLAAYKADKKYIDVELDRSTITDKDELHYFDNH